MHAAPHLYVELLNDDGPLLAHAILTLRQSDARGVTRSQADGHQAPLTCTQLNKSTHGILSQYNKIRHVLHALLRDPLLGQYTARHGGGS